MYFEVHKANILVSFQARADTSLSSELYYDANELLSKLKNDLSVSGGVTVGVGPAGSPLTVDAGVSGSYASSILKELSKYKDKVLKHNACAAWYSIIYTENVLL